MEFNQQTIVDDIEKDVVIQVEELRVWTPEEKSWWRRKITKPKITILNNVTGCIRQGEFIAILGPSGAGKTTFLVSLAGKCTLPSKGTVTINGRNVRDLQQGVAEIVPQFEVFMDDLSVMEHLIFMTEMKLGSYKKQSNQLTLDTLISELKLKAHKQTPIRGLSGGERRLLSLASSLLSNPQILICDEPTTGLDSYNAALVIGVLKKLALSGKVVICSVHQPSSDLFKEFNFVMLMAEGKLLYHGSQEDCSSLFESINLRCPKNYNPAEFYIKAVSNMNINENYTEKIVESFRDQSYECNRTGSEASMTEHATFKASRRNWFKQVQLLIWRSSLTLKRSIVNHVIQLLVCMLISALLISVSYVGITGTTQRGIQDIRGFLWLLSSEVSYTLSYNAMYDFENDIALFRREVGMYSTSAYFLSRFMTLMPRCVIWPTASIFLASQAVELPNHYITALEFIAVLVLTSIASTAYGLGMGALFISTGVVGDVMPCVDLPLFLMSGAFLRISSLPLWLYPVKYVSQFYYAMDAISNIYWRQIDYIECPTNSTTDCLRDGVAVLIENGYSSNFVLEDGIGFLIVTLIWCILGYYGLKREEKKGYAY